MANTRSKPKRVHEFINWEAVDEIDKECEERREFKLRDILADEKFEDVKETAVENLLGEKLTVAHLQKSGFSKPMLVKQRDNLGLQIPPKFHSREFGVEEIRSYIGSRRIVDALDTKTQKTKSMTMRQWCQFWITFPRKQVLNGISLEFSLTKLDQHIVPPRIVRQIDWIEKAWPRHLKEMQKDYTNNIEEMMYPKVQKFVIMSVASSYMDFHIDFGGTSVWYYLLRGRKIFWLVPPTDQNLILYESWVKDEGKTRFFGEMAEGCCRIEIYPGNTLFLPAGWIHAVFTVKDSIAFSGSFLHSFSIENQLKVNYIEDSLGVLDMHRFPFFTEMLWYVLDRYVTCLTGQSSLDLPEEEKRRMRLERGDHIDPNKEFLYTGLVCEAPSVPARHVHLTPEECRGLKFIVMFLYQRPPELRNVPDIIPDPGKLIANVRSLIDKHKDDCAESAVTGKYVLRWTKKDNVEIDFKMKKLIPKPKRKINKTMKNPFHRNYVKAMAHMKSLEEKAADAPKKRRRRCMECDGCKETDCKTCPPCRDMVKYGGLGRMRQSCVKRRCGRPLLSVAAACSKWNLDGWQETPDPKKTVDLVCREEPSSVPTREFPAERWQRQRPHQPTLKPGRVLTRAGVSSSSSVTDREKLAAVQTIDVDDNNDIGISKSRDRRGPMLTSSRLATLRPSSPYTECTRSAYNVTSSTGGPLTTLSNQMEHTKDSCQDSTSQFKAVISKDCDTKLPERVNRHRENLRLDELLNHAREHPNPGDRLDHTREDQRLGDRLDLAREDPRPGDRLDHAEEDPRPGEQLDHAREDPGPIERLNHAIEDPRPGEQLDHAGDDQRPGEQLDHARDDQRPGEQLDHAREDPGPGEQLDHAREDPGPIEPLNHAIEVERLVELVERLVYDRLDHAIEDPSRRRKTVVVNPTVYTCSECNFSVTSRTSYLKHIKNKEDARSVSTRRGDPSIRTRQRPDRNSRHRTSALPLPRGSTRHRTSSSVLPLPGGSSRHRTSSSTLPQPQFSSGTGQLSVSSLQSVVGLKIECSDAPAVPPTEDRELTGDPARLVPVNTARDITCDLSAPKPKMPGRKDGLLAGRLSEKGRKHLSSTNKPFTNRNEFSETPDPVLCNQNNGIHRNKEEQRLGTIDLVPVGVKEPRLGTIDPVPVGVKEPRLGTIDLAPVSVKEPRLGTIDLVPVGVKEPSLGTIDLAPVSVKESHLGTIDLVPVGVKEPRLGTVDLAPLGAKEPRLGTIDLVPVCTKEPRLGTIDLVPVCAKEPRLGTIDLVAVGVKEPRLGTIDLVPVSSCESSDTDDDEFSQSWLTDPNRTGAKHSSQESISEAITHRSPVRKTRGKVPRRFSEDGSLPRRTEPPKERLEEAARRQNGATLKTNHSTLDQFSAASYLSYVERVNQECRLVSLVNWTTRVRVDIERLSKSSLKKQGKAELVKEDDASLVDRGSQPLRGSESAEHPEQQISSFVCEMDNTILKTHRKQKKTGLKTNRDQENTVGSCDPRDQEKNELKKIQEKENDGLKYPEEQDHARLIKITQEKETNGMKNIQEKDHTGLKKITQEKETNEMENPQKKDHTGLKKNTKEKENNGMKNAQEQDHIGFKKNSKEKENNEMKNTQEKDKTRLKKITKEKETNQMKNSQEQDNTGLKKITQEKTTNEMKNTQEQDQTRLKFSRERRGRNQGDHLYKLLRYLLNYLLEKDEGNLFRGPITEESAPGYSSVVKEPMDFSVMEDKLDRRDYASLAEFKYDFNLIHQNCHVYNSVGTVYYNAATRLKNIGEHFLDDAELRDMPAYAHLSPLERGLDFQTAPRPFSGKTHEKETSCEENLPDTAGNNVSLPEDKVHSPVRKSFRKGKPLNSRSKKHSECRDNQVNIRQDSNANEKEPKSLDPCQKKMSNAAVLGQKGPRDKSGEKSPIELWITAAERVKFHQRQSKAKKEETSALVAAAEVKPSRGRPKNPVKVHAGNLPGLGARKRHRSDQSSGQDKRFKRCKISNQTLAKDQDGNEEGHHGIEQAGWEDDKDGSKGGDEWWIRCCQEGCGKWRRVHDIKDGDPVLEYWDCYMNKDSERNYCEAEEENYEDVYHEQEEDEWEESDVYQEQEEEEWKTSDDHNEQEEDEWKEYRGEETGQASTYCSDQFPVTTQIPKKPTSPTSQSTSQSTEIQEQDPTQLTAGKDLVPFLELKEPVQTHPTNNIKLKPASELMESPRHIVGKIPSAILQRSGLSYAKPTPFHFPGGRLNLSEITKLVTPVPKVQGSPIKSISLGTSLRIERVERQTTGSSVSHSVQPNNVHRGPCKLPLPSEMTVCLCYHLSRFKEWDNRSFLASHWTDSMLRSVLSTASTAFETVNGHLRPLPRLDAVWAHVLKYWSIESLEEMENCLGETGLVLIIPGWREKGRDMLLSTIIEESHSINQRLCEAWRPGIPEDMLLHLVVLLLGGSLLQARWGNIQAFINIHFPYYQLTRTPFGTSLGAIWRNQIGTSVQITEAEARISTAALLSLMHNLNLSFMPVPEILNPLLPPLNQLPPDTRTFRPPVQSVADLVTLALLYLADQTGGSWDVLLDEFLQFQFPGLPNTSVLQRIGAWRAGLYPEEATRFDIRVVDAAQRLWLRIKPETLLSAYSSLFSAFSFSPDDHPVNREYMRCPGLVCQIISLSPSYWSRYFTPLEGQGSAVPVYSTQNGFITESSGSGQRLRDDVEPVSGGEDVSTVGGLGSLPPLLEARAEEDPSCLKPRLEIQVLIGISLVLYVIREHHEGRREDVPLNQLLLASVPFTLSDCLVWLEAVFLYYAGVEKRNEFLMDLRRNKKMANYYMDLRDKHYYFKKSVCGELFQEVLLAALDSARLAGLVRHPEYLDLITHNRLAFSETNLFCVALLHLGNSEDRCAVDIREVLLPYYRRNLQLQTLGVSGLLWEEDSSERIIIALLSKLIDHDIFELRNTHLAFVSHVSIAWVKMKMREVIHKVQQFRAVPLPADTLAGLRNLKKEPSLPPPPPLPRDHLLALALKNLSQQPGAPVSFSRLWSFLAQYFPYFKSVAPWPEEELRQGAQFRSSNRFTFSQVRGETSLGLEEEEVYEEVKEFVLLHEDRIKEAMLQPDLLVQMLHGLLPSSQYDPQ